MWRSSFKLHNVLHDRLKSIKGGGELVHIAGVVPKQNHCLEVLFDNKHSVILDLSQKLRTVRFSCLSDDAVFKTATTDGGFISWGKKAELSVSEVIQLLQK